MAYAKIRPRRGTADQWTTTNPVLAEGEIGIEVPDTGVGSGLVKIKFGDGTTPWNDLPYGLEGSLSFDDYIVQNLDTEATDKVPSVSAVKSAFNELNSNLTNVQTYNFTSSYLRNGSFNVYKLGKLCWINIPSAIDNLPVKQNVTIANLPEELIPIETVQMVFSVAGTTKSMMLTISKNGEVILYAYGDAVETLSLRMTMTYISVS